MTPPSLFERVREGARNALVLLREGRLGAPYRAPFEVVHEEAHVRLRRYPRAPAAADAAAPTTSDAAPSATAAAPEQPVPRRPILLVPPLMVTSEIYDISPELSAVAFLSRAGADVWVADFGAPEATPGGMERTLDDHVLATSSCIDRIRQLTGHDAVHLVGYSQGGMFCYQTAAYRKGAGLASVITFGAPVDIHRNAPLDLHDSLAEKLIAVARKAIDGPLEDLRGLPATLSSRGFKLLAPRAELKHLVQMLGLLPDRQAFAEVEPKRRFLGGEGFIAWPGPALRTFIDEFVVHNRMKTGGFVVAGRTVALADIETPVLAFVGELDDLAQPESVRAIVKAAPLAAVHLVHLESGHFGLVVGTRAMTQSWPTVLAFAAWQDGVAGRPELLDAAAEHAAAELAEGRDSASNAPQRLFELATDVVDQLWTKLGGVGVEIGAVIDAMRWQLPRLARMASLTRESRVSFARVLAEQAQAIPEQVFFLWQGRAYTYAEADRRVTALASALAHVGVRRGRHVGVYGDTHPDYLAVVAALNRLGAVSVLLDAGLRGRSLAHALAAGEVDHLVTDEAHAADGQAAFTGPRHSVAELDGLVAAGVAAAALPSPGELDRGRGGDVAALMFTSGTTGLPRAAKVTNLRWIAAGLGTATQARIGPGDTVYSALPLSHGTGLLVAVGGAVVGGARLALAGHFSARRFWSEVRNVGATVVFYVGEMGRYLVQQPPSPEDKLHPVRLFAGNGLRADVWRQLLERFGGGPSKLRVLEFYSSTEGNVVLVNTTGDKVGSVGKELTGLVRTALVRWDAERGEPVRDAAGRCVPVAPFEPGLLLGAIADGDGDSQKPALADFVGYTDPAATAQKILRDVFEPGDRWYDTGDLLVQDEDGDHAFVDRAGDTYRWKGENVSTELVAQVFRGVPGVVAAAAYGVVMRDEDHDGKVGMVALELAPGAAFQAAEAWAHAAANLTPAARPRFVRIVAAPLPTTDSLKLKKVELQRDGTDPAKTTDPIWRADDAARTYVPLASPS
ncbi:MAG: alpha/beta fold hydrolase [Myxococcota bacterium]